MATAITDAMLAGPVDADAPAFARRATPEFAPGASRLPWHKRIGETTEPRPTRALFAVLIAALVAAGGLALRRPIIEAVPETAALYQTLGIPVNLRGLELRDVRSMIFKENGIELLIVQGDIANVTSAKQTVAPLKFVVRDAKGREVYSWVAAADVRTLDAGAKATFRRRLASPPQDGAEVLVRFAGKPDQSSLAN